MVVTAGETATTQEGGSEMHISLFKIGVTFYKNECMGRFVWAAIF